MLQSVVLLATIGSLSYDDLAGCVKTSCSNMYFRCDVS